MSLYVLQSLACSEVGVAGEQEALEADDELPDIVQAAALPLPGLALAPATSRLLDCLLCRQPGMCHQCSLGSIVAADCCTGLPELPAVAIQHVLCRQAGHIFQC